MEPMPCISVGLATSTKVNLGKCDKVSMLHNDLRNWNQLFPKFTVFGLGLVSPNISDGLLLAVLIKDMSRLEVI